MNKKRAMDLKKWDLFYKSVRKLAEGVGDDPIGEQVPVYLIILAAFSAAQSTYHMSTEDRRVLNTMRVVLCDAMQKALKGAGIV